jgi:hypothetical protein
MTQEKNTFLLYTDFYTPIRGFSLETKGRLLDAMFLFHIEGREIDLPEGAKIAFEFFKTGFIRNAEKYSATVEGRRAAGLKSAEIRALRARQNEQMSTNPTNVESVEQNEQMSTNPTNSTDNVNDNDMIMIISRDKSLSPDYANAPAGEHALISGKNSKSGLELLSESEPQTSKARKTSAPETDAAFNEFWELYPARNGRKLDKARTRILFGRLPARARAEVLTAVRNYAASGQMAKDPARFLRDDYWREWLIPAAAPQEAAGLDPAETEWRAMQEARKAETGEEIPCAL